MTDPLGQSQVLPYIIGLQQKGIAFTLISFEKIERFKEEGAAIKRICLTHNIDWQPFFYTKRPKVLSTLFDLIKIYPVIKRLMKTKKIVRINVIVKNAKLGGTFQLSTESNGSNYIDADIPDKGLMTFDASDIWHRITKNLSGTTRINLSIDAVVDR
jgi:hypothetical protein